MNMKESRGHEPGGVAFVGCILIGVGIGMLFDKTAVGAVFGAGVGFLVMAVLRATLGKR